MLIDVLEAEVREGLVGFSHTMDFVTLLHGAATTFGRIGVKVWIYKGEVLSQTLRTTPRTMDTSKPYQERRERRPRRDGDRRGGFGGDRRNGGFNRDRQGGFNRQGGAERRPQGGFRPNTNRPAAPAAPAKEGGAQ